MCSNRVISTLIAVYVLTGIVLTSSVVATFSCWGRFWPRSCSGTGFALTQLPSKLVDDVACSPCVFWELRGWNSDTEILMRWAQDFSATYWKQNKERRVDHTDLVSHVNDSCQPWRMRLVIVAKGGLHEGHAVDVDASGIECVGKLPAPAPAQTTGSPAPALPQLPKTKIAHSTYATSSVHHVASIRKKLSTPKSQPTEATCAHAEHT